MFALSKNPDFNSSFFELAKTTSGQLHAVLLVWRYKITLKQWMTLSTNNTASTYQKLRSDVACLSSYKLAYTHFTPSASFWDFHVTTICLLLENNSDETQQMFALSKTKICTVYVSAFSAGWLMQARLVIWKVTLEFTMSPSLKNRTLIGPMCSGFLSLLLRLHIFTY